MKAQTVIHQHYGADPVRVAEALDDVIGAFQASVNTLIPLTMINGNGKAKRVWIPTATVARLEEA
jgi:hypothetical protein